MRPVPPVRKLKLVLIASPGESIEDHPRVQEVLRRRPGARVTVTSLGRGSPRATTYPAVVQITWHEAR